MKISFLCIRLHIHPFACNAKISFFPPLVIVLLCMRTLFSSARKLRQSVKLRHISKQTRLLNWASYNIFGFVLRINLSEIVTN